MANVDISLKPPGVGKVAIDGTDIASQVRSLRFSAEVGCRPILSLELAVFDADVTDLRSEDAKVVLGQGTADLLIAAGWTPPDHGFEIMRELR